jgi:putative ABC transport system permease protein
MTDFVKQLRQAARWLLRAPGFAALCILPLAVGIGATTVIFSLVNGVVLNPLPYPEADRLVGIWHVAPGLTPEQLYLSIPTYLLYQSRDPDLSDIGLYREGKVNLSDRGNPERARSAEVTASLFRALRSRPQIGRSFNQQDERPGAPPAVMLSDGLWRRRFSGDPAILGKTVRIDGVLRSVAGVMGPDFHFPAPETDVWLPLAISPDRASLGDLNFRGVARLRPGVSAATAETHLNGLLARLDETFPGQGAAPLLARAGFAARVHPLRDDVVGKAGTTLWILLAAVGFILLIACSNVSGLLVVRGEGRQREMAIRTALGALRRNLVGGTLAEGLLLGSAACVLGLLLAFWGTHLLVRFAPESVPRLGEVSLDGRVLAFSVTVSLLVSLFIGLAPSRRLDRVPLATMLREGSQGAVSRKARRRLHQLLVAVQVALALTVLTGAGLMVRSFTLLSRAPLGFDPRNLLVVQLALPPADYPDDAAVARLFERLIDRVSALPGVVSAAAISQAPLGGSVQAAGQVIEGLPTDDRVPPPFVEQAYVSQSYFKTMGIPLRSGADLTRGEIEGRNGSVVIDDSLAGHYWPQGSPLGKRLRPGEKPPDGQDPWYTIVGIAGGVRARTIAEPPHGTIYYPLLGKRKDAWVPREMSLVLRTRVPPATLAPAVRREVAAADPSLPVAGITDMEQLARKAGSRTAFTTWMLLLALAVTLILVAVGTYGFASYVVNQRTPEIGIRIAIGAQVGHILRMILGESLATTLVGIVLGLAGSALLTRALGSLLYEVSPLDPLTFAAAPLLLAALVLLASYGPALRAAHTDPLRALRLAPGGGTAKEGA